MGIVPKILLIIPPPIPPDIIPPPMPPPITAHRSVYSPSLSRTHVICRCETYWPSSSSSYVDHFHRFRHSHLRPSNHLTNPFFHHLCRFPLELREARGMGYVLDHRLAVERIAGYCNRSQVAVVDGSNVLAARYTPGHRSIDRYSLVDHTIVLVLNYSPVEHSPLARCCMRQIIV